MIVAWARSALRHRGPGFRIVANFLELRGLWWKTKNAPTKATQRASTTTAAHTRAKLGDYSDPIIRFTAAQTLYEYSYTYFLFCLAPEIGQKKTYPRMGVPNAHIQCVCLLGCTAASHSIPRGGGINLESFQAQHPCRANQL